MLERIITALILVAVVLSCMFATPSQYPMLMLMIVAAGVAGYEWFKLMPRKTNNFIKSKSWFFGLLTVLISALALHYSEIALFLWCLSILMWCMSIYWVRSYPAYDGWYNATLPLIGFVLVSAAVTAIFKLWTFSPWWLMYLFLLVWGADSGAYFVGRKFGRKKLAAAVSPNKSVEGLFGGVITALLIIAVVESIYLDLTLMEHMLFLVLSVMTVFSSVLGDLLESMIKRRAGIKDSGRILPGHGGVLDRIDSLLAAAPVFATGIYLLKIMGVNL
ncbi:MULTISPECIES: phosphatidate cytidylyltransferase [unclassified Acinetobacter]|uniref:phosphatidate cytidylyltransferase n=1 Tax=unclassified Acinetobacter TaxID=196816 RepID=UPI00293476EB|nr:MULTISPECIES: CDP-archaeol synthase [unclassified Acinetobacter]WOE31888.1 CDP-archaeol synthase [Acinetobacter sp. SAAs470]WOE37355.1 CDP-archaeol synthase [Acinetobacter sp. SAAs474]